MSMSSPSVRVVGLLLASVLVACAHAAGDGLLAVGTPAPEFVATAHDGRRIALADLRGRYVALYFYPKDDTPGCTKEACGFRDAATSLVHAGVVVLGVSEQGNASHAVFISKFN